MPGGGGRGRQLAHPLGQLGDVGHEVAAHVWGGHHGPRAVGGGQPQQLEALVERGRAVVQPVQGVEVELGARCLHLGSDSAPEQALSSLRGYARVTGV